MNCRCPSVPLATLIGRATVTGSSFLPVVSPTVNFFSRKRLCFSKKGLEVLVDLIAQPSSSTLCGDGNDEFAALSVVAMKALFSPRSFLQYRTFAVSRTKQIYSPTSFRWLCCVAAKFSVNGTASLSACPTNPVAFSMSRADSNVLKLRSQFK